MLVGVIPEKPLKRVFLVECSNSPDERMQLRPLVEPVINTNTCENTEFVSFAWYTITGFKLLQ